jgi:hypothetical protein
LLTFSFLPNPSSSLSSLFPHPLFAVAAPPPPSPKGRIGNYEEYLANSKAYETIVIVNALSLLLLCIGMLLYGMILRLRLDLSLRDLLLIRSGTGTQIAAENQRKIQLLRRILIILGICTTCFLLRVICLSVLLIDVTTGRHLTDQIPLSLWYTLSQWLPNFGAGYTLLYIMRTKLEVKTRASQQRTTARQFQRSISGTSFRPSSCRDEEEGGEERGDARFESKASGISPIFIGSNDCDISHDGSGGSGVVRDSTGNPIQFRQADWSGEWIEGTEKCFPSDDS